jgi:DNA-binding NarL/FixJ family response regulator
MVMTRILVVEDHEVVRDALAGLLRDTPDMEVVGVASSIRETLPLLVRAAPDVVLADLSLGDGSSTELVRALRRARLKARVVIITGFSDQFAAAEALAAGVSGYVLKSQSAEEMLEAIRAVALGRQYLSPIVEARLTGRLVWGEDQRSARQDDANQTPGQGQGQGQGIDRLSRREVEIFRLVVSGCSSKEVARRLCISVKTVETHRTNMNRKLAVRTTADLVRFAVAHGITVAPRTLASDTITGAGQTRGQTGADPVLVSVDLPGPSSPSV